MNRSKLLLLAALMLLAACGESHRVTYSGHEESTEGVPGFVNGKRVSPNVKLGQSYSVDGETYVPHNQPDYVEEGLASWYGPGFHGGKTANGETFDKMELTGAHRTLPLPSIVRVTMLSTGKSVYVRINDRGPFAKSRIIDLSRAAAERIGLVRAGVAKVRVEYMPRESQRFADLLAQGRDPKSIDIASEVLTYGVGSDTASAAPTPHSIVSGTQMASGSDEDGGSFWDHFTGNDSKPAPSATMKAAPVSDVAATDLSAPVAPMAGVPFNKAAPAPVKISEADKVPPVIADSVAPAAEDAEMDHNVMPGASSTPAESSPFDMVDSAAPAVKPSIPASVALPASLPKTASAPAVAKPAMPAPTVAAPVASVPLTGKSYVQLGAFSNETNANHLRGMYPTVTELQVVQKQNAAGQTLYHVRMGPYTTPAQLDAALTKARDAGADAKVIRE